MVFAIKSRDRQDTDFYTCGEEQIDPNIISEKHVRNIEDVSIRLEKLL
jgi:Tfp pilus assembly PilM family ATPase